MNYLREIAGPYSKLYIKRDLLNAGEIHAWAISEGFVTTSNEMHVTIALSKHEVDWSRFKPQTDRVNLIDTRDRDIRQLDDAYVLRFYSFELWQRWTYLRTNGITMEHSDFIPHVTVSYRSPKRPLSSIKPYTGPLLFGPEEFKPFDFTYKQKLRNSEY